MLRAVVKGEAISPVCGTHVCAVLQDWRRSAARLPVDVEFADQSESESYFVPPSARSRHAYFQHRLGFAEDGR